MSRLGKKPIAVPANVKVELKGREVTLSSGSKSLKFTHRPEVGVAWDEGARSLSVSIVPGHEASGGARAYWGTTRALLNNMIGGVTKGYEKTLEVVGVGFQATVNGRNIDLKLGFANTIRLAIPTGLDVTVDKQFVKIAGPDKQLVGQFAADIRAKRKPEPYNGKGVKYVNEVIRRKEGKQVGA
ncbi:MAG TPA: 50S ribosomal protein L6 [Phycisphaerales bacterium]|nr:50S ribosomal protein L6 [Phycisphaerales bacterium]